jgi:multidrug efflux pump subunit AcrA (membrane-fusion protein)
MVLRPFLRVKAKIVVRMIERSARPSLNYVLGLLCLGAISVAILVVGPASGSQTTTTRTAKAAQGVVQSTVSGSGNLQPVSQLDLGFKTSGTVANIYVHQGQYVTPGQLLATLDPRSAEATLEQAKASLLSAEANLAREEETNGESTAGSTDSESSSTSAPSSPGKNAKAVKQENKASSSSSTSTSPATREANIASARASVKSDRLTVRSDEETVQDTKLYAPENGTIVSLAGQVGEVLSASGTSKVSNADLSSSSGTSSSAAGAVSGRSAANSAGSSGAGSSSASSSGSSGASSSSSSSFAVLSDLSSMRLVVAVSESEISHVKIGQIATVTVEALEGSKLAAHVSEVATLSTNSSGVVSYAVTFQLDQMTSGLKPGMSVGAEVVVEQAEGVNVPTSAISGGAVTVLRGGRKVRQSILTGLTGNSSTIVLDGVKSGETVILPQASTASSATSLTSTLRSRLGGSGGLGGGAGAFFRGGG